MLQGKNKIAFVCSFTSVVSLLFFFSSYAAYGFTFGEDNRVRMPNKRYPWSTIGRISTGCTGSLVARDLVLTNAHCVLKKKNGERTKELVELDKLGFSPDYTEHKPGLYSPAIEVHISPGYLRGDEEADDDENEDWAILRLSSPIGDSHGWLGIAPSKSEEHVTLAGYSGDLSAGGKIATIDQTCQTFVEEKLGRVVHNCDGWPGASGGPLFIENNGNYSIVALNRGGHGPLQSNKEGLSAKEYYNLLGELTFRLHAIGIAVQTHRFAEKVRELASTSSRK